jgi:hypothetical protein
MKKVSKYDYNYNSEVSKLTPNLRNLINRILTPVATRISLDEILEHPWMKDQK